VRDIKAEIVHLLEAGPVRRRKLLGGRGSRFLLTYQGMVKAHQIEERVSDRLLPGQAVYACLPGQQPPVPKITRPRRADVRVLMNAGYTLEDAVRAILQCDFDQLLRLLNDAQIRGGLEVPRRRGRPGKFDVTV
jgi:hypothetical protein